MSSTVNVVAIRSFVKMVRQFKQMWTDAGKKAERAKEHVVANTCLAEASLLEKNAVHIENLLAHIKDLEDEIAILKPISQKETAGS